MANYFLKVDKDLFKLGLNPTEILLLAQIIEFDTNTGDCFMSNKVFAENLGVSESTIKRELDKLEEKGFITRDTKNIQKGKERHIKVNMDKYKAKSKLNLAEDDKKSTKSNLNLAEGSKCPLRKEQNEPIKDNIEKITTRDNISGIIQPSVEVIPYREPEVEEVKKPDGTINNPYLVSRDWLIERHNELTVLKNGLFQYRTKFVKLKNN